MQVLYTLRSPSATNWISAACVVRPARRPGITNCLLTESEVFMGKSLGQQSIHIYFANSSISSKICNIFIN